MSENTTTETETTEAPEQDTPAESFGTDIRPAIKAYKVARSEARRIHSEVVAQAAKPRDKAARAMREVLGRSRQADAVINMFEAMSEDAYQEKVTAATTTRDLMYEAAQTQLDKALADADAFTRFVRTYITDNYGDTYTDAFYDAMPLTFDGLKELAAEQRWCTDFERAMARAVRTKALPDTTVEVRRTVDGHAVPHGHGAQGGETWEHTARIPAYVRTTDTSGNPRSIGSLLEYAVTDSSTWVKVGPVPVGEDDPKS